MLSVEDCQHNTEEEDSNSDDLRKTVETCVTESAILNRVEKREIQLRARKNKEKQRWSQNIFLNPYNDFLRVVTGVIEIESLIMFLYSPLQANGIRPSLALFITHGRTGYMGRRIERKRLVSVAHTADINCVAWDLYIEINIDLHNILLIASSLLHWYYRT